jgi:hypothetical protein
MNMNRPGIQGLAIAPDPVCFPLTFVEEETCVSSVACGRPASMQLPFLLSTKLMQCEKKYLSVFQKLQRSFLCALFKKLLASNKGSLSRISPTQNFSAQQSSCQG